MNCEECKALLLELVDGDLPSAQAAEVRAAATLCPECEEELARLEAGLSLSAALPDVPMPAQLSDRIMQVAHAHAAQAQATAIPNVSRVSGPGLMRGWLDNFVERFATGPQFAMATLMLLIAVGTFWAVPSLERSPEAVGGSVVTVDTRGEAVASEVALEPADRLDLAVDMRHGRIRTKAEQRRLGRRAAPGVTAAADALEPTIDEAAAPVDADQAAFPAQETAQLAEAIAEVERPQAVAGLGSPSDGAAGPVAAAPVPQAPAKKSKANTIGVQQMADSYAAPPPAAAPEPDRKARVAQSPRETLQVAREARKGGDCAAAVIYYERVILSSPRGALGTSAMREAAQCYASLGRARRARELESMLAQREDASPKGRKKAAKPVAAEAAAMEYAQ